MPKQKNINFKRRLIVAGLSALTLAVLVPAASTYAWGPDRPTYTMKKPADHPTFNSITDNNVIGDERDFVRVAEKGGKKWLNEVKIVPGKTYQVFIFYHNNAASNLNEGGKGYAQKAKIRSSFPTKVNSSAKGKVSATISSTTTTPKEVYDVALVTILDSISLVGYCLAVVNILGILFTKSRPNRLVRNPPSQCH